MSSETTGFAASTIPDDGKAALTEPKAGVVITASPIHFVDYTGIFRIWPVSNFRILFQPLRKSQHQSILLGFHCRFPRPDPLQKQENKAAGRFRAFPGSFFAKAILQIITLAKFLEKYSFADKPKKIN